MKRTPAALSRQEILRLFDAPQDGWPAAEKTLMEQGAAAAIVAFELTDSAFAASFLPKAAKKAAVRAALEDRLSPSRAELARRLADPSPKRRKQAARLVGALANPLDAPALIEALARETTRFVRPSMLLALGSVGGAAREALQKYVPAPPAAPEDEKHYNEEKQALEAALLRLTPAAIPAFRAVDEEVRVQLRGALPSVIVEEANALGLQTLQRGAGVELFCSDMAALGAIRSYREALLPLGSADFTPAALANLAGGLCERLSRWYAHAGPFPLRLEVRGVSHEARGAFIRESVPLLEKLGFANAPGAYAAELRVEADGPTAAVCVKLSAPDERFSYRKQALPASMHPADAAALIRYAFPGGAPLRVLDPCCGSGTLLIEFGKYANARLCGVDIAHKAIDAARENAKAARLDVQLIRKDLTDFIAGELYDALVANLPFGLRAGTHADNKALYPALLDRLPRWLKSSGVAALYTADASLLRSSIARKPFLVLKKEAALDVGGLRAHVFVVGVR